MSVGMALLLLGFKIVGCLVAAIHLDYYIRVSHSTNNGWKDLFYSIAIIASVLGTSR